MSRVRILNLPHDCTEKELKEHFAKNVPQQAPPMEVTDVRILRMKPDPEDASNTSNTSKAGGRGAVRGRGRGRGGRGGAAAAAVPTVDPLAPVLGKIRMAFVGFKSSAAGHFAVSHYNQSYFRSSKIRVELAKGLNEVGVTLNQRKKAERLERHAEGGGKRAREGEDGGDNSSIVKSSTTTTATTADDSNISNTNDSGGATADPNSWDGRKKARKELFIEERTKATGGPSWAADILIPQGQLQPLDGSLGGGGGDGGNAVEGDDNDDGLGDTERELAALEKQQALGAVSDLDFLSTIGGGGGNKNANNGNDDRNDEEQQQPHRGDGDRDGGEEEEEGTKHPHNHPHQGTAATASTAASQDDIAADSRRVRIGNIPYTATEDNVKQFAASLVGPVEAVHIPLTKDTRQSKGAAFVRFIHAQDAIRALTLCRGAILMGRLLRVSAAESDPHSKTALEREARQAAGTGTGTAAGGDSGVAGSSEFKIGRERERRGGGDGDGSNHNSSGGGGGAGHISWNTMYMNSSAAIDNVAKRLGVASEDLVSVQAKGAAVRAAIAEAYLTSEIQQVLSDEGVAFDILESGQQSLLKPRSNTTILVKNLQLGGPDEAAELSKLFVKFGTLETTVFPSSGTFALLRFVHPQDARTAFTRLAYKLFKNAPLFLEWAPVGAIVDDGGDNADGGSAGNKDGITVTPATVVDDSNSNNKGPITAAPVLYTLFITNIAFTATEDDFHAFLLDACPRLARAPETAVKRLAFQQDHGRAYLTLPDESTYRYCLAKLNGKSFADRTLACVASKQSGRPIIPGVTPTPTGTTAAAAAEDDDDEQRLRKTATVSNANKNHNTASSSSSKVPPGADPHKIIVKNVPFEATEADVRELFSAFSEVKSVRLPRKTNNFTSHRENNHRGFAFVEFLSETEAARAMEVLKATHLYGRHLVLQYAKLDR